MEPSALLVQRLLQAMALTADFVRELPAESLALKLPDIPSNTIGGQLWCVIGARESYLRALQLGHWSGFSCSLESHYGKDAVEQKLEHTAGRVREFFELADLREINLELAFEFLEHEVMHHGQLIRYAYGNRLSFPESWNERYTV